MSYPRDLEEYTYDEIHKEYARRRYCKGRHECSYCGKRLDSCCDVPISKETGCKMSPHNIPFPAHVATEAVLQGLADTIDKGLPSGRGFVLVVSHTADGPEGSFGSYVSDLKAVEVPELLRGTADYIEEREAARGTHP